MNKIKTKDVVTLVIATAAIVVSAYFMWTLLNPTKKQTSQPTDSQNQKITGKIDDTTYKHIEALSDYGQPTLENIGKTDLFAK